LWELGTEAHRGTRAHKGTEAQRREGTKGREVRSGYSFLILPHLVPLCLCAPLPLYDKSFESCLKLILTQGGINGIIMPVPPTNRSIFR